MKYRTGMATALLMYLMAHEAGSKSPRKPTIEELKPEYDLIQQKKSKLPRMQRDRVVYLYDKLYEESTNDK